MPRLILIAHISHTSYHIWQTLLNCLPHNAMIEPPSHVNHLCTLPEQKLDDERWRKAHETSDDSDVNLSGTEGQEPQGQSTSLSFFREHVIPV